MAGSVPAAATQLYYRLSGGYSRIRAAKALLMGILFAIPVACLYAWFEYRGPWGMLMLLATILFGRYMAAVTDYCLKKNLVRSVPVAVVICAAVALIGLQFAWAVWIGLGTELPPRWVIFYPFHIWQVIAALNAHGVWPVHSEILWLIFAGEAILIVPLTVYYGTYKMRQRTFCENCSHWAESTEGICYVAAGARPNIDNRAAMKAYRYELKALAGELRRHLEEKDFGYLEYLGAVPKDAFAWFSLDLQFCSQCGQTNTLGLILHRKVIQDFGHFLKSGKKVKDDEGCPEEIFRQLVLSPGEAKALRKLGKRLTPQLALLAKGRPESATVETVSGG